MSLDLISGSAEHGIPRSRRAHKWITTDDTNVENENMMKSRWCSMSFQSTRRSFTGKLYLSPDFRRNQKRRDIHQFNSISRSGTSGCTNVCVSLGPFFVHTIPINIYYLNLNLLNQCSHVWLTNCQSINIIAVKLFWGFPDWLRLC